MQPLLLFPFGFVEITHADWNAVLRVAAMRGWSLPEGTPMVVLPRQGRWIEDEDTRKFGDVLESMLPDIPRHDAKPCSGIRQDRANPFNELSGLKRELVEFIVDHSRDGGFFIGSDIGVPQRQG
jgi:hypothetical protein